LGTRVHNVTAYGPGGVAQQELRVDRHSKIGLSLTIWVRRCGFRMVRVKAPLNPKESFLSLRQHGRRSPATREC
jgi:hypothetical protein